MKVTAISPAPPATAASVGKTAPAGEASVGFAALLEGVLAEPHIEEEAVALQEEATENGTAALAMAGHVSTSYRGLEALNPVFRERLERVIERMESEFGHRVTVVETVRSQERQEFLYAQGRTRPGPVVTWTLNSNHRTGRAADVMIDGSYNDPRGYARLAQIAQEEGLQTLGPRDPGHIELPRWVNTGDEPTPRLASPLPGRPEVDLEPREVRSPINAVAAGGVARVARVAEVAEVAQVARVAEVAQVAEPGMRQVRLASATTSGDAALRLEAEMVQGEARIRSMSAAGDGGTGGDDAGGSGGRGERGDLFSALVARATTSSGSAAPAQGIFGTDLSARIARVMEMQESGATRPLSSILLRLDNPAGGEDRIRVGLRGSAVDAQIHLSNPEEARRAGTHIGELRQALERLGLEADALKVRAAGIRPETTDAARAATALADDAQRTSQRSGSDTPGQQQRNRTSESTPDDPHGSGRHKDHPKKDLK